MEQTVVKDIMVPVSNYATVSKNANLLEAMHALENENMKHEGRPYRHRAVLVLGNSGKVLGKISQIDIMAALEPNYLKMGPDLGMNRIGFSMTFIRAVKDKFKLWDRPLSNLFDELKRVKVADVMYTPADHQKVNESDTLETAMHQIIMGRHHSLLVIRKRNIVGILRSTDLFNSLYDQICGYDS